MDISIFFFGRKETEAGQGRWDDFRDFLRKAGAKLSSTEEAELGIWIDHDDKTLSKTRIPKCRRVLVQIEPATVHPRQYSQRVENQYHYVISELADQNSGKLFWRSGQFSDEDICDLRKPVIRAKRTWTFGLINANKNSFVRGSNYPLRRQIISNMTSGNYNFALAGRAWDASRLTNFIQDLKELWIALRSLRSFSELRFPFRLRKLDLSRYQGEPDSARNFLESVEVALVVENENGYFSEKLTDALYARCHVLYVGPDIPNLSKLRNVTLCPPDINRIMDVAHALANKNNSGIDYNQEELETLSMFSTRTAANRFMEIIQSINAEK